MWQSSQCPEPYLLTEVRRFPYVPMSCYLSMAPYKLDGLYTEGNYGAWGIQWALTRGPPLREDGPKHVKQLPGCTFSQLLEGRKGRRRF